MDPRLPILYLVGTGLALFLVSSIWILLGLLGLQVILWFVQGHSVRDLARAVRRLLPFVVLLVAVAALSGGSWQDLTSGAIEAAPLAVRLLAMVIASRMVQLRAGGRDLILGLTRLGLPMAIGAALDATLSMLTDAGPAREGGRGGRGGRRRVVRQIFRGDVSVLVESFEKAVGQARTRMEPLRAELGPARIDDLAVISAVALVSAAVRAVRILPGIPFAPGHKSVIVIPLYTVAAALTRSRWGATQAGAVMGTVSVLLGDGRFGIFEILKFLSPGLVVDASLPWIERRGPAGRLGYAALGLIAGLARFSTTVAVAAFVGAPAGFFALLIPFGIAHAVFGALSGLVVAPLLRAVRETRKP